MQGCQVFAGEKIILLLGRGAGPCAHMSIPFSKRVPTLIFPVPGKGVPTDPEVYRWPDTRTYIVPEIVTGTRLHPKGEPPGITPLDPVKPAQEDQVPARIVEVSGQLPPGKVVVEGNGEEIPAVARHVLS